MQTKTYFASSVPAALELARKELGEDAMLVSSRLSPPDMRAFGKLEVTFAWDPKTPEPPPPAVTRPVFSKSELPGAPIPFVPRVHHPGQRQASSDLDEIRREITDLKMALNRPDGNRFAAANDEVVNWLTEGGLEPATARELSTAAARRSGDRQAALLHELTARLPYRPFSELEPGENRTLAFVGPPGRGKTTTLVKIAAHFGLARRVPVKIYTAGSHGVYGEEQMARYSTILGVPFLACESLESLGLALNGDAWKGLTLIDTPGISPSDSPELDEFARFFSRRPNIEIHLVLRADARSADMSGVISRFSSLGVSRLLFTGVDETLSLGAMAETLLRSQIPSTFVGTGQRIPDDLGSISAAKLAQAVCGEKAMAALAA